MRRDRIDLRVRTDEKQVWEEFAKSKGLGLSELIRRAVNNVIRLDPTSKKKSPR